MRIPIVTIILADVLHVALVIPVQSIHHKGVCSYPAHLFIDVLAKVLEEKEARSVGISALVATARLSQSVPTSLETKTI
jgi:hypothetical protein